jgi:hypothetical protein
MKKALRLCAFAGVTLSAASALAADVTGTWTGTAEAPNGEIILTFTFRQDGDHLSGTMKGPQGGTVVISNGRVNGDQLSFDLPIDDMTKVHDDCTVNGDQIKMSMSSDDVEYQGLVFVVRRGKDGGASD